MMSIKGIGREMPHKPVLLRNPIISDIAPSNIVPTNSRNCVLPMTTIIVVILYRAEFVCINAKERMIKVS